MGILYKNTQLMLDANATPYINDIPDDVISNITIYANDTTLYPKCDLWLSDLWQQLKLASEFESDLQDSVNWGRKCLLISRL